MNKSSLSGYLLVVNPISRGMEIAILVKSNFHFLVSQSSMCCCFWQVPFCMEQHFHCLSSFWSHKVSKLVRRRFLSSSNFLHTDCYIIASLVGSVKMVRIELILVLSACILSMPFLKLYLLTSASVLSDFKVFAVVINVDT